MAVKSFMTNNLVKEHDMYVDFMKHRNDEITNGGDEPTEVLFYKDCLLGASSDAMRDSYIAICKWHCITISYDIWCSICNFSNRIKTHESYKDIVDVSDDGLKKFKYRVEQTIKNAGCDYNAKRGFANGRYDAPRYLAMFWTYLDIVKDDKTQRFYPSAETRKRAAKIFGYLENEDPFIMNGKYYNKKLESNVVSEVDPYEIKIEDMMLTTRTFMCLKRTQHKTLGDILEMTIKDLMHVRNFGLRSLREVIETLNKYGYSYPINPDADPDAGPLKAYITTATPIKAVVADIKKPEKKEESKQAECKMVHPYEYNVFLEKYNKINEENEELKARIENLKGIHERNKELSSENSKIREQKDRIQSGYLEAEERIMDLNNLVEELKCELERKDARNMELTDILDLLIRRCKAERIPTFTMTYNSWNISVKFDGSFVTIDSGDDKKGWSIRTTRSEV
ncbi:MAG: hypothetical protein IJ880_17510 [Bacilli bacterium]|nr:hypothetical protein [Bacilli bacterium]